MLTGNGAAHVWPGSSAGVGERAADTRLAARADSVYRADLDGLRGLAIALVVVFHVWMGRVSGGVDVFLVLSGFFFTGMLLRRNDTAGSVGIWWTLRRTGRRLLPALSVVLAAVFAATIATRPYTQWGDLAAQAWASAMYCQNWYLARAELDYLAPDPSVSPLQHLWSMAVQGQFYVVMLVVIAMWARLRPRQARPMRYRAWLLAGLVVPAATSFCYAAIGSERHQAWTYYDSGARAWELLVGAGLAIAAPWIVIPRPIRALLAILGLGMVVSCGLLIDGATRFPGPAALYPVLAAVAVILSGVDRVPGQRPWVNRLLASPVPVELGALAYSLYLWHWPVLIFFLAECGKVTPGVGGGLLVIGVSLLLALATRWFIEAPLRQRTMTSSYGNGPASPQRRRFVGAVVTVLGVGVLGSALGLQTMLMAGDARPPAELAPVEYPGAAALFAGAVTPPVQMRPSVVEGSKDAPAPTVDGCITRSREVRTCVYGDVAASRSIAVVGGSHSEHWLPALEILAVRYQFRVVTYLKEGCPLTLVDEPSYSLAPFPECREWSIDVLDRLAEQPPDWVFTIATRPRFGVGDDVPPEFLEVWSALSDRGLNILAIRDTPWLRRDGVHYRAVDCLAQQGTPYSCGVDRADALDPANPAEHVASAYPNVFPLDLSDSICRADRCQAAEGNVLIYRDEHHLTASYARSMAPELGRRIGAITQWW